MLAFGPLFFHMKLIVLPFCYNLHVSLLYEIDCAAIRLHIVGLWHRDITTTVVIDLYDPNTITMVACESCCLTEHFKKVTVRIFKAM